MVTKSPRGGVQDTKRGSPRPSLFNFQGRTWESSRTHLRPTCPGNFQSPVQHGQGYSSSQLHIQLTKSKTRTSFHIDVREEGKIADRSVHTERREPRRMGEAMTFTSALLAPELLKELKFCSQEPRNLILPASVARKDRTDNLERSLHPVDIYFTVQEDSPT